MNELISVIIPIYNLEEYLQNCIESVITQTYHNLEIILVDDGSTDNSIDICRVYEKKDRRIQIIIKQKNEGAGPARNAGIDVAHGSYIMFVDGDDFIARNCIEELYTILFTNGGDISVCLGREVYGTERIKDIEQKSSINFESMTAKQALENLCYQRKITPGPCGKLFKKDLFSNLRFPDTGYEDMAIIYRLLDRADSILFCPIEKYYYLQRKNNTTLGRFNKKKLDRISVAKDMMEFLKEHHSDLIKCAEVRFFIANIQTLNVLPFDLLQSKCGKEISKNIRKYRWVVLGDNKAKISTRCIAFTSYMGMFNLKLFGILYNFFHGNFRVKLM